MRILYLGSGAFGLPTLRTIAREHTLAAVVTQPDRPAGRSRHLTPTPVASWCEEIAADFLILKPENINEKQSLEQVRAIDCDAWVVIAYGQKLSKPLLHDRFAINLHASVLPRWRGAAPINHAILAGDTTTGNSVITVVNRMDAGAVLGQSHRDIPRDMTAGHLHDLLSKDGPDLMLKVLREYEQGTLQSVEQDESLVTLAKKLSKQDAWVNFEDGAESCRCRINGLSPWPGVTVQFRSEPLRLLRANAEPGESDQSAGTVVDPETGLIACPGDMLLRLVEVQPAGKRVMQWLDFARGRSIQAGEQLTGGHTC